MMHTGAAAYGGQLGADPGFDVGRGPLAEGGGPAGCVHQGHHDTQDDQENQDAYVPAVRQDRDHAVLEDVGDRPLKGEPGVEEAAHNDPDKEGTVDFLGDQRQQDGDHRRNQSPKCCVHFHYFSLPFFFCIVQKS